ncbi:MAG: Acetyl-CoA:oxalate CoA-transferase [Acidimicrobiales bacterium]|nr:MAG: CoA transferase [Actinomycetota bacterium]MBV6507248.1 Acetyl-CoA:oxalate CoA-transferase [Acidimicrobiales bacterium]RIK05472.1 MAG: carnitine dehydratase [Acidobacteriota bacterium]
MSAPVVPPAGPLNGVTVVDLTRVLAGPFCTLVLADLGARVIKVERPGVGDDARHIGPFLPNGLSGYFASLNRGKESISIDLEDRADRQRFDDFLASADVLVENFKPGAMDRLGYSWEVIHARHPRLVYAGLSGFGRTGPLARQPAYDMVAQAMGGVMSITGPPGGPPTRVGSSIGDIAAGLYAAVGVISALHHRDESGEGMLVDVAMLDCQVALLENAIARFEISGQVPTPIGSRHPSITPFGAFEARDDLLVIAAGNNALFAKLSEAVGRPDLPSNSMFSDNASRTEHETELRAELERSLRTRDVAHWLGILQEAGIPCSPIHDVADVLAHPQVLARNMVVTIDGDDAEGLRVAGNPVKLSAFPDPMTRGPVPRLER